MKILFAWTAFAAALLAAPGAGATTVLVTGSDRGLGFEFTKQYAERGWTVIATTRNPGSATALQALAASNKNIIIEKLDVLDKPGLEALAAKYRGKPIDILINNAGLLGDIKLQTLGHLDYATFQQLMGVNAYGALAVSDAFRDNVIQSEMKKIVAITSTAGIISGKGGGRYFYRASKIALNMLMKGLEHDLHKQGVIVGLVSPGAVDTDMGRQASGAKAASYQKADHSVAGMIKVIDGLTQANSDKPIDYDGTVMPW